MAPRSSAAVVVLLLLLLQAAISSRALQQSGPTAEECQSHIEAAIRDFAAGRHKVSDIATSAEQADSRESETDEVESGEQHEPPATDDSSESQKTEGTEADKDQSDEDASNENVELVSETDDSQEAKSGSHEEADADSGEDDHKAAEQGTEQGGERTDEDVVSSEEDNQDTSGDKSGESEESAKIEKDDSHEDVSSEEDDFQNEVGGRQQRDVDSSEAQVQDDDESSSESDERHGDSSETDAGQSAPHDAEPEDQGAADEGPVSTGGNETASDGDAHPATEQSEEETSQEEEAADDDASVPVEDEEVTVAGPGELRSRENIKTILGVSEADSKQAKEQETASNAILKDVKRTYESAVRPLEQLYKYRDISNRHVGDAEIFSKPMILFMGPWSTGKSAIINYLLGTEYSRFALKTSAEPTSNSFTVVMYGETDQTLDGTQIAADWAFSTLQKFGQTFLDRLRGRRLPNPLLQKVTIVDTPGILENRKTTERQYPLNDAFQWFIDRADLIYIVFDPTKLDVGPELEALFDQLKGRENNVRILLNKADTVKPQELMKVQGTLLWNLSPELSTSEAPTVFVGSFWSRPYLPGSPVTLLDAQEEAFLEDLDDALKNRVEAKVALARRHAVRVRNHAKMVDCYLTTYYNHKSIFSNKRKVADDIIDNPQNYHIYEGLSTMTNVSRYDLPDPDIYREFFHLHALFDFKPLASTCSYFKGCPLDKLDIAIAYDLPELVTKYHKLLGSKVGGSGGH